MKRFKHLFVAFLYPEGGAGTGGAGGSGGEGGALTPEQVKELEEKHGLEKKRLSDEAAKERVAKNKERDEKLAAIAERDAARKELEEARRSSARGPDATGTDDEKEARVKEALLRAKNAEDRVAKVEAERAEEKRAALQKERDSSMSIAIEERISSHTVRPESAPLVRAFLQRNTKTEDDGSQIFKAKDLKGEMRELPVADVDLHEFIDPAAFQSKAGGGSGGRSPAAAGSGKSGDVLREYTQAEWDKFTPDQRKAIQRERTAATGARVR